MNAKQINELLTKKGGYNKLNDHERNEVIKFVLRATPITTKEAAINLLKGGMIIKVYKQFLQTVERKFNPSQRKMVMMALEPVYGSIKEHKNAQKGGEKQKKEKGCSSDEHWEAVKRMSPFVRTTYLDRLKKEDYPLWKELTGEINRLNRYKGGNNVKPHYNQNLNNGLGHIKMRNEDGSFTYY